MVWNGYLICSGFLIFPKIPVWCFMGVCMYVNIGSKSPAAEWHMVHGAQTIVDQGGPMWARPPNCIISYISGDQKWQFSAAVKYLEMLRSFVLLFAYFDLLFQIGSFISLILIIRLC